MVSDYSNPINIGSEEMVSINELVEIVGRISGKQVIKNHKLNAPTGVRGRNSSNKLIREILGWDYSIDLTLGMDLTYKWISSQIDNTARLKEKARY